MLLFIGNCVPKKTTSFGFQNISCYCLSICCFRCGFEFHISKHLMLLFIGFCAPLMNPIIFISKHLMLLFIDGVVRDTLGVVKFQNISCYCLSRREVLEYMELIAFQNISCYCLSETECAACRHKVISKHLMLLFI